jgi:hypothetical protein
MGKSNKVIISDSSRHRPKENCTPDFYPKIGQLITTPINPELDHEAERIYVETRRNQIILA